MIWRTSPAFERSTRIFYERTLLQLMTGTAIASNYYRGCGRVAGAENINHLPRKLERVFEGD